jgi:hypothetical protein
MKRRSALRSTGAGSPTLTQISAPMTPTSRGLSRRAGTRTLARRVLSESDSRIKAMPGGPSPLEVGDTMIRPPRTLVIGSPTSEGHGPPGFLWSSDGPFLVPCLIVHFSFFFSRATHGPFCGARRRSFTPEISAIARKWPQSLWTLVSFVGVRLQGVWSLVLFSAWADFWVFLVGRGRLGGRSPLFYRAVMSLDSVRLSGGGSKKEVVSSQLTVDSRGGRPAATPASLPTVRRGFRGPSGRR